MMVPRMSHDTSRDKNAMPVMPVPGRPDPDARPIISVGVGIIRIRIRISHREAESDPDRYASVRAWHRNESDSPRHQCNYEKSFPVHYHFTSFELNNRSNRKFPVYSAAIFFRISCNADIFANPPVGDLPQRCRLTGALRSAARKCNQWSTG